MNFTAKPTTSEQVISTIISGIKKGNFKVGQRLPSQRDMARLFGVSRTTVRDAVKNLEGKGIITSRRGSGIYICKQADSLQRNKQSRRYKEIQIPLGQVLDFARSIYSMVCILAIEYATDEELSSISESSRAFYDNYNQMTTKQEKYIYETSFGTNIGRSSHNPICYEILLELIEALSDVDFAVVSNHVLYREIIKVDLRLTDALSERNKERAVLWGKERDAIITQILQAEPNLLNKKVFIDFHFSLKMDM